MKKPLSHKTLTSFAVEYHFHLGELLLEDSLFEFTTGLLVRLIAHHEVAVDVFGGDFIPCPADVVKETLAAVDNRVEVQCGIANYEICI